MQCHEIMWNDLAAGSALFNSEAVIVEISSPKGGLSTRRDLLPRPGSEEKHQSQQHITNLRTQP